MIDNPKSIVKEADIITVEDDGTDNPVRKYSRVEAKADVEVLEFDGEGIISKELSYMLTESGQHYSFQIRLPYIKGVVHEVDFKKLFSELRVITQKALAFEFEVGEATVSDTIKWVENALIKDGTFSLPGKKVLLEDDSIEVILVDVTECPIERPQKTTKALFRQKEKTHNKSSGCR